MPRVRRRWSATDPATAEALVPRDDVLLEAPDGDGTFRQADGPFREYRRTLTTEPDGRVAQTTRYSITIPWFRWLFGPLVRWSMKHRPESGRQPWWAPPDRLNQRQTLVLGLLAAASMCSAYVNTLFSQTVSFAADEFGVGTGGQGVAGTFVRAGIVFMLPVAFLADRAGRRRVIRFVIFAAPIVASLGAFAPNFAVLTATQTLGRPLGLALDLLITVVAAEEMPRNSRAYAVSLMAMAQGLGSGVCVMSLRLADSGPGGWRTIYLITLVFLLVAFDVSRRLPETERFQAHVDHQAPPGGIQRGRLLVQCAAAFFLNMFLAPASFFQNRYLDDVRGYSGGGVALFTVSTATPAALGIVVGGEAHDRATRLQRLGENVPLTTQTGVAPDVHLQPSAEIMGKLEIEKGLVTPTIQYALIDNALRFHEKRTLAEHRAELGALWGDFNRVAVGNPDAPTEDGSRLS